MDTSYSHQSQSAATSGAGQLSANQLATRYGKLADYLVKTVQLKDEGVFRQIAREAKISFQAAIGRPPSVVRITAVLSELEPIISQQGKQFNLELYNALRKQRALPTSFESQQFKAKFVVPDGETYKQEFLTQEAEQAGKTATATAMTQDQYQQPYYPCSAYTGPWLFDKTEKMIMMGSRPEHLKTSRYNEQSLSEDGRVSRVHAGTSSFADLFGHTLEIPDQSIPGMGVSVTHSPPPDYNQDGTYSNASINRQVCAFWQKVFSSTGSVVSNPDNLTADMRLVVDGKLVARQARISNALVSDSLAANVMRELPTVVVAVTQESGSQFIKQSTRADIDLVRMIENRHITFYCADETLVRIVGLATLKIMFGDQVDAVLEKVPTDKSTSLAGAALRALPLETLIKAGLPLLKTQNLLQEKFDKR